MSSENVRFALLSGKMQFQGSALNSGEIRTISEFVTGKALHTATFAPNAYCSADASAWKADSESPHWNGWGAGVAQHRFQPAAMAGLSVGEIPRLKLKWAFGFPGDSRAFAQPTVVGGHVFVGSQGRKVYSLDARTGCIEWVFESDFPVRSAITLDAIHATAVAFFGDQHANVYAVNARTGTLMWKTRIEEHPAAVITGAPVLAQGRLYVPVSSFEEVIGAEPSYSCCKFRGSVSALDISTGKTIWKTYTIPESPHPVRKNKQGVQLWGPSGASVWSSPTIDLKRGAVYITTGDSYSDPAALTSDAFLALDLTSGKLLWSRQITSNDAFTIDCMRPVKTNCAEANGPDFDFGYSAMLIALPNGRRALVAGQKSGMLHAVDPDEQGEVIWQVRIGKGGVLGGIQWGSAYDGEKIYSAVSDVETMPAAAGKAGVRPGPVGMRTLNPNVGGGLFALEPATGKRVWYTPHPGCGNRARCSPAQSAAVTAIPGVVFSGSLDGRLRAYSSQDGHILWDFDTAVKYRTVNGVEATGGAIDGPGPVVVGGMLFTNSGYGTFGGAPGNVLLAFSAE